MLGFAPEPAAAYELPTGFQESVVLEGLESPAAFDFTPDGRIMFAERIEGRLRIASETSPGQWQVESQPFATFDVPKEGGVPTEHRSSGLRGFAFDPDYASNGYLYVFYMKDNPRQNRVVRIRRDPSNPNRALPGETLLIDLPFNASGASGSHNGGALRFGQDGMLYITTGDGWSGGDGVQSLSTFTGKVLRIRPDGSIPSSNPFYSEASGSYRAIYALGLRNPYTLSRNDSNGWLMIGEARGEDKAEILRLTPGANFRHQNFNGIGISTGRWVNGAAAGNETISGGAWYPAGGPFPSEYHGAYFMSLWGTNGADGGPPGQLSYVRSSSNTEVVAFDTSVGQFDGAGIRLKPVHLRVGPDGALYYLMTSYMTGAGSIARVSHEGSTSVATPSFSPDGGTFTGPTSVSLSTSTPGVEIRWTQDGSEPQPDSRLYIVPIPLGESATLRARAFAGNHASSIASADFTIGGAANVPPVANAGPDQTVAVRTMTVLNGAASYDPDGNDLLLSENWVQVSGPTAEISNADEATALFLPTRIGRYEFRLDVTDGTDSHSDFITVRVLRCINDSRESLVARWSMDEGSGSVALDSAAGIWNGTLEGPTWSPDGVGAHALGATSGALRFNGAGDVVQLGAPDVSGNELTMTGWIRADDFDVSDGRILSKASGVLGEEHFWMLSTFREGGLDRLRFRIRTNGTTSTLVASGAALRPDEWIFVAATYDGQTMRLYQDGELVGSKAKTGAIATSPAVPAAIGNQPDGSRSFDGLIDEVRLYSRALSPEDLSLVAGEGQRLDCLLGIDAR